MTSKVLPPRARGVIADIATATNRLMPCGDARSAIMLVNLGLTILVDSGKSEFTGAYRLTPTGVGWVKVNLNHVVIAKEAIPDE